MDKWNEIRTAYKLAQLRTLSATAAEIGVHRSTVMRHIDTLEDSLGVKLFQRNDKGYIPTEAGLDIMRLGEVTDNHFSQLPSLLKSKEQTLEGTLSITCVSELTGLLLPSVKTYQALYPKVHVDLMGDIRNFNLEYAEADIAIRGGEKPTTPDNIVWPLQELQLVLCAHKDYVDAYGLATEKNFNKHRFIALKDRPKHLAWNEWIHNTMPRNNIAILGTNQHILSQALMAGCGIGALPKDTVEQHHELVEIPSNNAWQLSIWALVHRDMRNAPKIKKFLEILLNNSDRPITLI